MRCSAEDATRKVRRTRLHRPAFPVLATMALITLVVTAACKRDQPDDTQRAVAAPTSAGATATPAPTDPGETGFEEIGRAAGLDFTMRFLAGEQGENFKINLYDHGAGVTVGDTDGDGLDDIYLMNQLGSNALFRNRGDGTFADVTSAAGIGLPNRICSSATLADYDNDGDQDLFVASTRGGNVLLRNDGTGHFEDVTAAAGVAHVGHSQGVSFFDYDGDGLLDLLVTNTAKWTIEERDPEGLYHVGRESLWDLVGSEYERNLLYHNRGDGTFTEVAVAVGLAGDGWGGDVAVFDIDGDVDLDLYVTNMFGRSTLYRNDDGVTFTDVTEAALGRTPWGAVGCKAFDFDGDARLDLYVVDMHSDMWIEFGPLPRILDPVRRYAGPEGPTVDAGIMTAEFRAWMYAKMNLEIDDPRLVFGNALYRNRGDGTFEDVDRAANAEVLWPWGIAAADFDLDGWEDVFIPRGMGYPFAALDNELLMNRGGRFVSESTRAGVAPRPDGPWLPDTIKGEDAASSSRTAAVIDLDSDGRLDFVVNNFNERPYLYHNRYPARPWVGLRLRGTECNRDAIGAVVRLTAGGRTQIRQVQAAGGYLAQSSYLIHFGLGAADAVERCEITWPDGSVQELTDVEPGRVQEVVQAAAR